MIISSKKSMKSVKFGDDNFEQTVLAWAAESDDLSSEENDDEIEHKNIVSDFDDYSKSCSDGGVDYNSEYDDDNGDLNFAATRPRFEFRTAGKK